MQVKFTDVDYRVFTDAARHVQFGRSPYDRHTYRYTPLLAYLLVPNLTISPLYGKCLFCLFDLAAGYLIYELVRKEHRHTSAWPLRSAYLWLYNPLVLTVSSRGNAESIVVTLVLASLYLFRERVFFLSGMCLALGIHFKLYPIIYFLPLTASLTEHKGLWNLLFDNTNPARFRFVAGTLCTLALLTGIFYHIYGMEFLDETYLYHVTRKDTRHNFSVYFYMLYLTFDEDDLGLSLITFLPQFILLLAFTNRFCYQRDLPFCLFCQTFVFVVYNKVCTSQYFLWYLSLLPLVVPHLGLTKYEAVTSLLLWGFTQASWLLPAYFLEFKGYNTFQFIWIESLAFFAANVGLLSKFVRMYREEKAKRKIE